MRKALAVLMHLCGFAATLAALWSFLFLFLFASRVIVSWNAAGYRKAVFTVAWVAFDPGDSGSGISWAEGTVDGVHERLYLDRVLPRRPTGWDDAEAQVHPRQRFDVLYNRDIP